MTKIKHIDLSRFIEAQESHYERALAEIKSGKKISHWMWYIFPQLSGLGHSKTSQLYAIGNLEEAREYLGHEILGKRLVEISDELLKLEENNASNILGSPDDLKLKSSMTLFCQVDKATSVFQKVLDKFFDGSYD